MFGINKNLQALQQRLEQVEAAVCSTGESGLHASEELSARLLELSAAANRHDLAIGDLLDSWEELQEEQRRESRVISAAFSDEMKKQLRQSEQREADLLELVMCYCDQFYGLRRAAAQAEIGDWSRQLSFVEEKLSAARLPLGFQVICDLEVPVNYSVHEVIDTVETRDPEQEGRVADVYGCGYLYRGTVLRKATVSAYRLKSVDSSGSVDGTRGRMI